MTLGKTLSWTSLCVFFASWFGFAADLSIPQTCSEMESWDLGMQMCMPLAMAGMPMRMLMLHGQAFAGQTVESGPRGRSAAWSTSMVMADLGTSLGSQHYLNLDFMGTAEKWTLPDRGYPELLQIGELDQHGVPFVDAQHPHNSPVMGLTLSDNFRFSANSKNNLKVFFAPRGESTDGPLAFMHRPTGLVNPDAPLGHHVGQDVGHVSSTVVGASLTIGTLSVEASTFHGAEPEPESVDLKLGNPNSFSLRLSEELSPGLTAMISAAYVQAPEPDAPDILFEARYSASLYHKLSLSEDWLFQNALIYGGITKYDHASMLSSFTEEWLFSRARSQIWGRLEILQRTAGELEVPVTAATNQITDGRWVSALTAGYTYQLGSLGDAELGLGGSVTHDWLPGDLTAAYGGSPWSGKLFLRIGGSSMWNL